MKHDVLLRIRGTRMNDLDKRIAIARIVADFWREAALRWGDIQMDGRVAAHPLSLVMAALDGEANPVELGISPTDPAWNAILSVGARS